MCSLETAPIKYIVFKLFEDDRPIAVGRVMKAVPSFSDGDRSYVVWLENEITVLRTTAAL